MKKKNIKLIPLISFLLLIYVCLEQSESKNILLLILTGALFFIVAIALIDYSKSP